MEEISYFPSSPLWRTMSFIIISAMGERQILPWQMKRIFIMDTKLPSMPKYADLLRICKLHMSTSISTKFCKKRHNLPNCSSKNDSKAGFPYCRNFSGVNFSCYYSRKATHSTRPLWRKLDAHNKRLTSGVKFIPLFLAYSFADRSAIYLCPFSPAIG